MDCFLYGSYQFIPAGAVVGRPCMDLPFRFERDGITGKDQGMSEGGSPDILLKIKSQSRNQIFKVEGKIRKNYFMIHYTD